MDIAYTITHSSPPRRIPYFSLCNMRNKSRLLIFSVLLALGIPCILCGFLVVSKVFPQRLVYRLQVSQAEGNMKSVKGTITKSTDTGIRVGGHRTIVSKRKLDDHVWRIEYKFLVENEVYTNYGFVAKREKVLRKEYHAGNNIAVNYISNNPGLNKIKEGLINHSGLMGLIALVFPLAGIIFTLLGAQIYRKDRRLLKWGVIENARVRKITPGRIKIGGYPVYHLHCEINNGSGQLVRIPTMGVTLDKAKKWQDKGTLLSVLVLRDNTKDGLIMGVAESAESQNF